MKKLISFLMAFIFVAFCFSACSKSPESKQADLNRDAQGYVQFIADFNTGLFGFIDSKQVEEVKQTNVAKQFLCFSDSRQASAYFV